VNKPKTTTTRGASKASERPPTALIDALQGVSTATPPTARKRPPRQNPDRALSLVDERVLDHLIDERVLDHLNVGGTDALSLVDERVLDHLIDERVLDHLNVGGAAVLSMEEQGLI
jgi:DNA repair protein RadC